MSDFQILTSDTFDTSTVTFTGQKDNKSGGKNVGVLANGKALLLSTPLMLTWGMNEFSDDATGRKTYDLALQFPSAQYPNADASTLQKKLMEFEDGIKKNAVSNSKDWFNKSKMSEDVVNALWTPMLKYPKDQDGESDLTRAPTLKVKIPFWDQKWVMELYDMDEQLVYPTEENKGTNPQPLVPKRSNIAVVLQSGGIWFANGKFGTTWKLVQGVVKPKESLSGKCRLSVKPEEREVLNNQPSNDDDDMAMSTQVVDSDDEAETATLSDELSVAVPAVEAANVEAANVDAASKKKKVVKKKIATN